MIHVGWALDRDLPGITYDFFTNGSQWVIVETFVETYADFTQNETIKVVQPEEMYRHDFGATNGLIPPFRSSEHADHKHINPTPLDEWLADEIAGIPRRAELYQEYINARPHIYKRPPKEVQLPLFS